MRRASLYRLLFALSLGALAGCTDDGSSGGGPTGTTHVESYFLPLMKPPKLDLLFVVDDTTAMASHQAALQALPAQIEQTLNGAYSGVVAHYHIGVVTTDAASAGAMRRSSTFDGAFIIQDATFTGPANNYQGTLADAIASVWPSSAASTAANQPLATSRAAFENAAANSGFLRDDAFLGIVTLTASDDASSGAVEEYVSFFKSRKADPANVIVTGALDANAARLAAFHAQFPNRNDVTSIDSTDYSELLSIFAQLYKTTLGYACNKEPADLDPETPGAQVDCSFVWVENGVEHLLPACGTTTQPCWEIVMASPQICTDPSTQAHLQTRGFTTSTSTYGDPFHPEVRGQCLVN